MREYTEEEVREKFLRYIKGIVKYWATTDLQENDSIEHRCDGVAFSILSLLDGGYVGCPAFIVAPYPHESDKDYTIEEEGETAKWYPENHESNVNCDIAGGLHEIYATIK